MDRTPEIGDGPDGIFPLLVESQVESRDGPGAGPRRKDPLPVDPEVFPSEEERERFFGILQGTGLGPSDVLFRQADPQPVIDGHRDITEGREVPAPAGLPRLGLVPDEIGSSVHHQQEGAARFSVPFRTVDVHLQGNGMRLPLMKEQTEYRTFHIHRRFRPISHGRGIDDVRVNRRFEGRNCMEQGAHKQDSLSSIAGRR